MSNAKLRSAKFSINELVKKTNGYSFASQADMRHMLIRCIKDLHHLGFKIGHIKGLQPKHIYNLVNLWKAQDKNTATIKNYMSKLRRAALLLDNPKLIKPDNDAYDIAKRSYTPTYNKAIHNLDLSACTDPHIRLSLEGQALFGLRREESMKFTLSEAWQDTSTITILPSWTKGGVGRVLLITNATQKQWLEKVNRLVSAGKSLIPQDRTYKQHLHYYQKEISLMGLSKLHGLRHSYAQERYYTLTRSLDPNQNGWHSPIAGGPQKKNLTSLQKKIDLQVRYIISRELGHTRLAIVQIYCG